MRFFIFKNDLRQFAISNALEKYNFIEVLEDNISNADVIILPFNNVTLDDKFLQNIKKDALVFTGVSNKNLKEKFQFYGLTLITLMDLNEIAVLNSIPTAEGVIYNILEVINKCIFNSNILTIGYGICGSEIANKLILLGANVSVIEKDTTKKNLAKLKKIDSISEKDIVNKNYDAIINTVPSKVISSDVLKNLDKNTIILDIASPPYGFDIKEINDLKINYRILSGLPSKFGLEYSGENISKFIYEKYIERFK